MNSSQHGPLGSGIAPTLSISGLDEVGEALLVRAQWERGLRFLRTNQAPGTVADPLALLPEDVDVLLDQRLRFGRTLVVETGGLLAEIVVRHGVTRISVAGADLAPVESLVERLLARANQLMEPPPGTVAMRFWSFTNQLADMSTRRVSTPSWEECSRNYPGRTRDALGGLMTASDVSDRAGRLVLWHGAPGTGKTTAVRTLSREWAAWCQPHYVMDPERLFSEPQYLLEVSGADDGEDEDDDRWRLVVAEDCDEYLRADAKQRAGASLGRLLNLCDGILGHGLKVLVLLTTNEDLGGLHPAVTRPGRCLAKVEFELFSPADAAAWLGSAAHPPTGPSSLAELYALAEQRSGLRADRALQGGYL